MFLLHLRTDENTIELNVHQTVVFFMPHSGLVYTVIVCGDHYGLIAACREPQSVKAALALHRSIRVTLVLHLYAAGSLIGCIHGCCYFPPHGPPLPSSLAIRFALCPRCRPHVASLPFVVPASTSPPYTIVIPYDFDV